MRTPTISKDTTIPLGSVVEVTNAGHGYSSYQGMAEFMGLTNWGSEHSHSRYPRRGKIYHVVSKGLHETQSYGTVLGLQDADGKQCMIGITGVKLIAQPAVVSVSGQVVALEQQLAKVTAERDALQKQIDTVRNLFIPA